MYASGCYGPSWLASIGWRGQCGTPMTISSDANRISLLLFRIIIITITVMIIIFITQLTSSWLVQQCPKMSTQNQNFIQVYDHWPNQNWNTAIILRTTLLRCTYWDLFIIIF